MNFSSHKMCEYTVEIFSGLAAVKNNFAFSLLDHGIKKIIGENKMFANQHRGERCFIILSGATINMIEDRQWNLLKNENVIGVNYINKFKKLEDISPKYWFFGSQLAINRENYKLYLNLIDTYTNTFFFIPLDGYRQLEKRGCDLGRIRPTFNHHGMQRSKLQLDFSKNITNCRNVAHYAIQGAIYMGFKEIYLLGCDFFSKDGSLQIETDIHYAYNYSPGVNMMETGRSLAEILTFLTIHLKHHYLLNKYAISNGSEIYNLSPDSLLDAYKRDTLSNILG